MRVEVSLICPSCQCVAGVFACDDGQITGTSARVFSLHEQLCCSRAGSKAIRLAGSSRCIARGVPFLAASDHDVENADQLAHAGNKRDLGLLSLGDQAAIEGFCDWIVLRGSAEARHEDGVSNPAAAALDVALAAALSAIVVVRSNAYQRRGNLIADLPELRHPCHEDCGGRFGEA